MPTTPTVTSFFTFTDNTKAVASELNTNFSTFRGHMVPVDPSGGASTHNIHQLGDTDASWLRGYFAEPPFLAGNQQGEVAIPFVYDGTTPPSPILALNDSQQIGFLQAADRDCIFQFEVPYEYIPGKQIKLSLKGYANVAGDFRMSTRTTRLETGDGQTSTSKRYTSTIDHVISDANQVWTKTQLLLTESAGTIGTSPVAVGDKLSVSLKRVGTHALDTLAADLFITDIIVKLNN